MATTKKATTKKRSSAKNSAGRKPRTSAAKKAAPKKVAGNGSRAKPAKKSSGKVSALDAAAKVLAETKQPMNCKAMIEAMAAKRYWKSPAGKTPWATLYSALLREINTKGKDARFKKAERGKFALAAQR